MQVLQINPISFFNNSPAKQSQYCPSFGLKMQKPAEADIVSFRGPVKFEQFVEKTAANNNKKLSETATVYMDVLESIAMKLKDIGISFDRDYCEPNAIKSAKSVVSKIKRAKTFKIPDRVRGTIYSKHIYDLSILFDKILPELKKRGYVIAYNEMPLQEAMKRGYIPSEDEIKKAEIMCPDIDIRLDNSLLNAGNLSENVVHFIGKPQVSGYEDIQIRLVKQGYEQSGLSNFGKTLHELIILTGPEYARTKHEESEKIYSYLRQFKELNIFNRSSDETTALIKRYMDLISKIFSTEISQKIYENAKSYDIFGIKTPMPISLNEDDEKTLTGYYDSIEKLTKEYYKKALEAKAKNERAQNSLKKERKEDLERLAKIRKGLTDAVDFYRNEYNKTGDTKKKSKNNA